MLRFFVDLKESLSSPYPLASWVIASVLVGISGPFGTYLHLEFPERCIYWTLVIGLAIFLAYAVKNLVRQTWPTISFWRHSLVSAVALGAIFTPLLRSISSWFSAGTDKEPVSIIFVFSIVFAVFMSVSVVRFLVEAELSVPTPLNRPRLMDRLNEDVVGPVLRLTVDDHYVEVHTDAGVQNLLMRFKDAIQEMEGVEGMCVHRSHWVAMDAVVGIERSNGRIFVELRDGSKVPVSRKYRVNVENAGLV